MGIHGPSDVIWDAHRAVSFRHFPNRQIYLRSGASTYYNLHTRLAGRSLICCESTHHAFGALGPSQCDDLICLLLQPLMIESKKLKHCEATTKNTSTRRYPKAKVKNAELFIDRTTPRVSRIMAANPKPNIIRCHRSKYAPDPRYPQWVLEPALPKFAES